MEISLNLKKKMSVSIIHSGSALVFGRPEQLFKMRPTYLQQIRFFFLNQIINISLYGSVSNKRINLLLLPDLK